jgi:hypothetical protein
MGILDLFFKEPKRPNLEEYNKMWNQPEQNDAKQIFDVFKSLAGNLDGLTESEQIQLQKFKDNEIDTTNIISKIIVHNAGDAGDAKMYYWAKLFLKVFEKYPTRFNEIKLNKITMDDFKKKIDIRLNYMNNNTVGELFSIYEENETQQEGGKRKNTKKRKVGGKSKKRKVGGKSKKRGSRKR